jgi:hypothetical protein
MDGMRKPGGKNMRDFLPDRQNGVRDGFSTLRTGFSFHLLLIQSSRSVALVQIKYGVRNEFLTH